MLAIVIGRGNKEENAVDISNRVLKSHNFNKLSNLSFHELEDEFKNQVPAMKMLAMKVCPRPVDIAKDAPILGSETADATTTRAFTE